MEKNMFRDRNSGQILLITLLVLTVGMTIALALIGQTRINVSIGNELEDSARAFAAAEAGIEEVLRTGSDTNTPVLLSGQLATYTTQTTDIGTAVGPFTFPKRIEVGETANVWLVGHNLDGTMNETKVFTDQTMDICWKTDSAAIPGMAVSLLYKRAGSYYVARLLFDRDNPNGSSSIADFSEGTACGQDGMYYSTLSFWGTIANTWSILPPVDLTVNDVIPIALRLRPTKADAYVSVQSATALPKQGEIIESTGETNSGVSRKVIVSRLYRSAPSIFDAAVVSQSNFSH